MACTLTVDGPCRRTLSFSIERGRLEHEIEQEVRRYASQTNLKGFRPGKAPIDLVRKSHGDEIAEEARRRIMSEAFGDALREHELRPVGEPEMNLEALQAEGEGPFTFEFTVEVAPDFELEPLEDMPVSLNLPTIDDGVIEGQIQQLRERAATPADAPADSVVSDNDVLTVTITYTVGEQPLEPRSERVVLVQHDIVDGVVVAGSGEAFKGQRVGDRVELTADLPAHFEPAELAGRPASLEVVIDKHQLLVVPPLDQAFLERLGVESEDELRTRIREQLEVDLARRRDHEIDRQVEARLLELHGFELPSRFTSQAVDRRVHEYAHRLIEERKLDPEQGHQAAEAERERIDQLTRDAIKASFIFSRIAQQQELGATVMEAENQIRALARMRGEDPEGVVAAARKEGWMADMMSQLTEEKTRAWLRERARITEEEREAPGPASGS